MSNRLNQSAYNKTYFAKNKAAIVAKRRVRRQNMSEDEKELRRAKTRDYRERRNAELAEAVVTLKEYRAANAPLLMGFDPPLGSTTQTEVEKGEYSHGHE